MTGAADKDVPEGARLITGSVQVKLLLTQTREIVATTHLYHGESVKDRNQRIDELQDALDRQAVRCDIVTKRARITQLRAGIEELMNRIGPIENKIALVGQPKEGGGKHKQLSSQEEQTLTTFRNNIHGMKKEIESLTAAIAEAEKVLVA